MEASPKCAKMKMDRPRREIDKGDKGAAWRAGVDPRRHVRLDRTPERSPAHENFRSSTAELRDLRPHCSGSAAGPASRSSERRLPRRLPCPPHAQRPIVCVPVSFRSGHLPPGAKQGLYHQVFERLPRRSHRHREPHASLAPRPRLRRDRPLHQPAHFTGLLKQERQERLS